MSPHYTQPDAAQSSANGENVTDLVAVSPDYIPNAERRLHTRFLSQEWREFSNQHWVPLADGRRPIYELRFLDAIYDYKRREYIPCDPRFHPVQGGWFDHHAQAAVPLSQLSGVGGFVSLNPVRPSDRFDRLGMQEFRNRIGKLGKGLATANAHILCRRWIFVDIDAVRAEGHAGESATDGERDAALELLQAILDCFPDLAKSAIWGTSGNGAYLLVRLPDLPNDDATHWQVAEFAAFLGDQFDNPAAHVDRGTHNAARIITCFGTLKVKGPNQPERPWRRARLLSPPGRTLEPLDLQKWIDTVWDGEVRHEKLQPTVVQAARETLLYRPFDRGLSTRRDRLNQVRIRSLLRSIGPAISGQRGHDRAYNAASLLVWDFALDLHEALNYLRTWNYDCLPQWNEHELIHKLEDARNAAHTSSRGHLLAEGEQYAARRDAERLAEWEAWDRPDETAAFAVTFDEDEVDGEHGEDDGREVAR